MDKNIYRQNNTTLVYSCQGIYPNMDVNIYDQNITILSMNEAGRWLKRMREGKGFSYRDLGKEVKVNHTTLAQAEEGRATVQTWIKLAEYFDESVLQVLYWAKKMKQPPSNNDVILEMQNRVMQKIIESFPEEQWDDIYGRLLQTIDFIDEHQKRISKVPTQKRS